MFLEYWALEGIGGVSVCAPNQANFISHAFVASSPLTRTSLPLSAVGTTLDPDSFVPGGGGLFARS